MADDLDMNLVCGTTITANTNAELGRRVSQHQKNCEQCQDELEEWRKRLGG